jgi:hypothetical protein
VKILPLTPHQSIQPRQGSGTIGSFGLKGFKLVHSAHTCAQYPNLALDARQIPQQVKPLISGCWFAGLDHRSSR